MNVSGYAEGAVLTFIWRNYDEKKENSVSDLVTI